MAEVDNNRLAAGYTTGEVAGLIGLTHDQVRHYVKRGIVAVSYASDGLRVLGVQHSAAAPVLRILQAYQGRPWLVDVVRPYRRLHCVRVQPSLRIVGHCTHVDSTQRREAAHLVVEYVRLRAHYGLVAALAVGQPRDQVGHRPACHVDSRLFTQPFCGHCLQLVHGRVLSKDVVAHLRLGDGFAHLHGRMGYGITSQVYDSHGDSLYERLSSGCILSGSTIRCTGEPPDPGQTGRWANEDGAGDGWLLDISRFWGVVKRVVRHEIACNGGVVSCLRRGFVSNVMSSTRLNSGEILAEVRNESDSGAKLRLPRGAPRRCRRGCWALPVKRGRLRVWCVVMRIG